MLLFGLPKREREREKAAEIEFTPGDDSIARAARIERYILFIDFYHFEAYPGIRTTAFRGRFVIVRFAIT